MSSTELYVKDARVWIPHAENVWQGAVVLRDYKEGDSTLELITDRKEAHTVQLKSPSDLPHLRNPAILIGQNDLTALSYLHEPDVLYNLEVRFCDRHNIYTYCGIVLVAINPYAELPLYGAELIRAYRGHSMGELEPHIFAVAEEAYAKLEREKCDISIIVSGESGAGKTVSAKYAMRYFAAVGGSESETQIEKKVLASSPIMEAIGNAKTTRNDNSSRFGKFTKLLFTNHLSMMSLTGGTMQTYLLEKSRVVFQAPGERNYHIFYQLCAARQQWPELMLDHQDKFHFLNQGHSPDIVRVSDEDQFRETVNAFKILGFDDGEISDIMKVLAAVLHLGNVEFTHKFKKQSQEVDQEACNVASDDLHVNIFSDILKLNRDELRKWLITRQIESINDTVLIPQSKAQSEAARDALAKHIYAEMFQYIVHKINRNLAGGKKQNCFIGVLDIYGFETFEVNSFEQFCINYANEKLQQQFNQHVFKLEQEQYLKEGIEWKMIDFYDNQPCIDLIETKLGILDLLDEECRMPRGSDESWVGKLFEKCSKYKHFDKPRFGTSAFLIKHFSDTVQYESHGFLEKNRDTVSKELVNVLRLSKMKLCHKLMTVSDESPTSEEGEVGKSGVKLVVSAAKSQPMTQKQQRKTVGSQFRESLTLLITTLHNTTPHYVRCIKPNDDKAAFQWEAPKIVQQLRACGVLETVRISAAGFPSRWTYEDFYDRYRLLCKRVQIVDWNVKATCGNIVRNWLTDPDKYRLGNTQIFFRAGQVAYLEQLRSDLRKKHIIKVQSLIRRFICRNKYLRLKRTALGLQRHARGMLARKRADNLRKNRAAIKIQRYVRGWLQRIKYRRIRRTALRLQTYARGLLARRKFKQVLDNYKATQIQRFCRGYLARQRAHQRLANIIKCQATVRRFLARRMFKRLKAEARTISHIQKMYKGLENKIIELQQRYDQISKENAALKKQNADIPEMRQKMAIMKQQENDLKALKLQLEQKDEKLLVVIKQLENERDEKMILLEEKQKEEEDRMKERAAMEQDLAKMREQVNEISDVTKLERDRLLSQADSKEIHVAYQRMVEDKNQLENENSNLRHELRRLQHLVSNSHEMKTHSRSVSNASSTNEEDYGYNSGKNTLEIRRSPHSYEGEINNNSKRYSGNGGGNVVTRGSNAAVSPTAAGRPPPPAVSSMSNGPTSIGSPPPSMTSGNNSSSQNSLSDTRTLPKDSSLDFERVLNRTPVGLFSLLQDHSTPNNAESAPEKDQTAIILKMRMLFEEEKSKSDQLRKEIARFRKSSSFSTEDSIRASELEVEIEKLRQDYNLLRNSIKRGVEDRELMEQHNALQEELKRRRDECISLKAVLAQQSHSLRTLGQSQVNPNGDTSLRIHDEGELMEAFQAQKLVNRQLESELRAMMDASNETLVENNKVIEALRKEVQELQAINQGRLDTSNEDNLDSLKRNDQYLRHELKKSTAAYVDLQEQVNELLAKLNELTKKNNILSNRLRDHGLNDSIIMNEEFQSMVVVKKKAHSFQGILKYRHEDENKIIQRLVTDLKPRVAVTLMPSLPAYVVFMCIRYTDSVNTDQLVRSLLTRFVQMIKRLYKLPNVAEVRVMWLVNTLTLHNLLKQFGGYQDYMQYNTEEQNLQQLKNFDLSEYRQVIYELIILMHGVLLRQVQESIKQYIVPAILDHDETARGKSRGRTMSLDMSPEQQQQSREPKSLVQQLDTFYKHLSSFGMESNYIEQIFKQLMYYICAVAVNSLMLRGDLCVWKTGMKIHYNVGCLERWVRSMSMDPDVFKPLEPLYQISRILQARKTVEDVPTLLELSTCLTTAQILKIIKSYTTDDCENEITPLFIETLTRQLNERSSQSEADTYMMDEEIVSPLVVVYKYSEINLKEIELPEELNLDGLVTKI